MVLSCCTAFFGVFFVCVALMCVSVGKILVQYAATHSNCLSNNAAIYLWPRANACVFVRVRVCVQVWCFPRITGLRHNF